MLSYSHSERRVHHRFTHLLLRSLLTSSTMPKKKNTSPAGVISPLPLTKEVWGLINTGLSLKDWACAAGVCKAAWRTQIAGLLAVPQSLPVEGEMNINASMHILKT